MATVNIYLHLPGNCREVFDFYKAAFGGEYASMAFFKDMPPQEGFTLSPEEKEMVMHVSFPISAETVLMGSDSVGPYAENFKPGSNFAISVKPDSREEADALFEKLSPGGRVVMAMQETFWGSYYGMFSDKFGISWMINLDIQDQGA